MSGQSEISEAIASANSPETLTLRETDDTVPEEVSAYRVTKFSATDQSAAQNDVTIQSFDGAAVDKELTVSVPADGSETVGDGDDDVLEVISGNSIRVAVEGDAEVTVYLTPIW